MNARVKRLFMSLGLLLSSAVLRAAEFPVITPADSGVGSLRQAILDANAIPGSDTISGLASLGVIALTTPLPVVTDSISIRDLTINGSTSVGDGLVLMGGGHTVERVSIYGVTGNALVISGGTGTRLNRIHIGVSTSGFSAPVGGNGLVIENAHDTHLGDLHGSADENQISSCGGSGIVVSNSHDVTITATTTGALRPNVAGNQGAGLRVVDSQRVTIGRLDQGSSNVVASANGGNGIELVGASETLLWELSSGVWTNPSEQRTRGNEGAGLMVEGGSANEVRSCALLENGGAGIVLRGDTGTIIDDCTVRQNGSDGILLDASTGARIGSLWGGSIDGNKGRGIALTRGSTGAGIGRQTIYGNSSAGVAIDDSPGNIVGGSDSNTIYQNDVGVLVTGSGSSGNLIAGNDLGTQASDAVRGNRRYGVLIAGGASGNNIGRSDSRNTFVLSGISDLAIESGARNRIGPNVWYCRSTGMPIDLGSDGPTFVDIGDLDAGANDLINAPVLSLARSGTETVVEGIMYGAVSSSYDVDFYVRDSTACRISWLGTSRVTTEASGRGPVRLSSAVWLPDDGVPRFLLATATDMAGNTSEFSGEVQVQAAGRFEFASREITASEKGGRADVVVIRRGALGWPAQVSYRMHDRGALGGKDYTPSTGMLTFAPGVQAQTLTIPIIGDSIADSGERFSVELFDPTGELRLPPELPYDATVTVTESLPRFSIGDAVIRESNGDQVVALTVSLDSVAGTSARVGYRTVAGSAAVGEDFVAASGVLEFVRGETTAIIVVTVKGELVSEADEELTVHLENASGATIEQADARVVIENDDGVPRITVDPLVITEGEPPMARFRRTGSNHRPSALNYRLVPGTAGATEVLGGDHSLRFEAEENEKTVELEIQDDSVQEDAETFTLVLFEPENAIVDDEVPGTILADFDPDIVAEIEGPVVQEGDSGRTAARFAVSLSVPLVIPVTLNYAAVTGNSGSAEAGTDFDWVTGALTFAPGERRKEVEVQVIGDLTAEPTEELVMLILTGSGSVQRSEGKGWIVNDDGPLELSIADAEAVESDGSVEIVISLNRPVPAGPEVRVNIQTRLGSARSTDVPVLTDYDVYILPGENELRIPYTLFDDTVREPDEQFTLSLENPSFARIVDGEALITIRDDDESVDGSGLPLVIVRGGEAEEPREGSARRRFEVALSRPSDLLAALDLRTASGTATESIDFSGGLQRVVFLPGETKKMVEFEILADDASEGREWFYLVASNAVGAVIDQATGVALVHEPGALPARRRGLRH